jgi:hypothetical protein
MVDGVWVNRNRGWIIKPHSPVVVNASCTVLDSTSRHQTHFGLAALQKEWSKGEANPRQYAKQSSSSLFRRPFYMHPGLCAQDAMVWEHHWCKHSLIAPLTSNLLRPPFLPATPLHFVPDMTTSRTSRSRSPLICLTSLYLLHDAKLRKPPVILHRVILRADDCSTVASTLDNP